MGKWQTWKCGLLCISLMASSNMVSAADETEAWIPKHVGKLFFAVAASDFDKSVNWYKTAFGLKELDRSRASDDRWQMANLSGPGLFVEVIRDARNVKVERAQTFLKVGYYIDDIEGVANRIEAATGTRPRILTMKSHGIKLLQIRDPDGNIIQLHSDLD
ncbi:MAG: hypothetical protein COB37_09115 [Kordiimonadales bacterium]|nr:MAG: hypothetical protein COB37_09115 [Kordiimonadales bacterium]